MAIKQLNSRIQWKKDTVANWESNNPVLLDGEIIIVDIGEGETRFKIGDGTSTYTQLPFQDEYVVNQIPSVVEKTVRFVVGTSTAGWTSDDCDYLCDGTDDQVEINAAIRALPATGGEIKILDGTYNISARIYLNKNNVKLSGNGNSTILKRMWDSSSVEGVITITASNSGCYIENFYIDGNTVDYNSYNNYGIVLNNTNNNTITGNTCNNSASGIYLLTSSNNTITGNTCNNNDDGIYLGSSNNTITGNTCNNNSENGIYLNDDSNTITGNTCNNNSENGIYIYYSHNNTIVGNTCNNNNSGIKIYNLSSINTIIGNTCIRGTGQSSDYTSSQYTIYVYGSNNLIANNNIMGKDVRISGGNSTGNTVYGNKWNDTIDVLITPQGTQGQVLGYVSDNVVGAIDLPQGKIVISATVTNSNWTSSGSYVYQQITCEGMTANSLPFVVPQYNVLNDSQQNDWNQIVYIESFEGYCRIYAKASFANNINVMITY